MVYISQRFAALLEVGTSKNDKKIGKSGILLRNSQKPREAKTEIPLSVSVSIIKRRAKDYGHKNYSCAKM